MESLTKKQELIYNYIKEKIISGYQPSVREIACAVSLRSPASVKAHLDALEEKGYIKRDKFKKRSIQLIGFPEGEICSVPLVGRVAAGEPILAQQNIEGYIPFCGHISGDKTVFALRVCGESMTDAGILDGDIIFAEQTSIAENGEIVVAMIDDEATVKTFYKENGYFRLQPQNSTFEPIITNEVTILGKVIALTRKIG